MFNAAFLKRFVECHKMRYWVMKGANTHFTLRELFELFLSWQLWLLVLFGSFLLFTGNSNSVPQVANEFDKATFLAVGFGFYVLLLVPYVLCACGLWNFLFRAQIPIYIASPPLSAAAIALAEVVLEGRLDPLPEAQSLLVWQGYVRFAIVVLAFECAALAWVLPMQRVRRRLAANAPETEDTPEPRTLLLDGRRFVLADLRRVSAAEHYIELQMVTGDLIIRERMKAFLEQVSPNDGVQTHRSHWVASSYVDKIDGSVLMTVGGDEVPIARGRMKDVRAWVDHRKSTSDTSVAVAKGQSAPRASQPAAPPMADGKSAFPD